MSARFESSGAISPSYLAFPRLDVAHDFSDESHGVMTRASSPPSGQAAASLRCYLVEDSPVIRENLIATLEEMLPLVVVGTAEDEDTAVNWMNSEPVPCDLMIVDMFLKSGTGLEVLKRASVVLPSVRRVVLTNYATPDMRKRCLGLGADRVFDKSAELEELLDYCEALCRQLSS